MTTPPTTIIVIIVIGQSTQRLRPLDCASIVLVPTILQIGKRATRSGIVVAVTNCATEGEGSGPIFVKLLALTCVSILMGTNDILSTIVQMIQNTTNPLQFAISSITLRRQMEISCQQHLFPLLETIDNLYRITATYCGSMPASSFDTCDNDHVQCRC